MSVKLKENKDQARDLINKIKEKVLRLPEFEREFIVGKLQELNLTNVIDLINAVNNWYLNENYKGLEKIIKSHLYNIHTWLKRLEKTLRNEDKNRNEAKKAELVEEILNIVRQLPNSDKRDGIINTFEKEEINEKNLKLASDCLQAWLDCEEVGEFSEEEQDSLLRIDSIIDDLLEILKEN